MAGQNQNADIPSGWLSKSTKVARGINLAWWLETIAAPLVIIGIAGAAALLLVRHLLPGVSLIELSAWTGGSLIIVSLVSWLVAKRHFETPESSMVRIEETMEMGNALSAARAGVRSWPPLPAKVDTGFTWNWPRIVVPPLAAITLLAGGLFIPVKASSNGTNSAKSEPQAWERIEADLERLEREDNIDENYIEETRKQLEELRSTDEDEWFSHSSLEATDALEQKHNSELNKLERDLDVASRTLGSLQEQNGKLPKNRKDALTEQFDQALQGLQNGALKPNEELLEQLKNLDPQNLGQLNQDQVDQLRENLEKAKQACKDCKGNGNGGPSDEFIDALLDGDQPMGGEPNQGNQEGPEGEEQEGGRGGIDRGPGHSGGVLGDKSDPLASGDLETLKAKDLSNSLPGDLLQLQDSAHDASTDPVKPQSGGSIGSTGAGGDRVWRESLDPEEQKTIKRFFE